MKDNYYEFFKKRLLDRSDEKECFDNEIEETLKLFRQKIAQINKLEKKIEKEKVYISKHDFVKIIKKLISSLIKKIRKRVKSIKRKGNNKIADVLGVSVIIPTYKKNEHLYEAVESITNQKDLTCQLEIIVAVNGDDYEYFTYLSDYYRDQNLVRVIYTKHKGVAAGRNLGIKEARFNHIIFVDDDDYLSERYISLLVNMAKPKTAFVCGCFADFNDGTYNVDNYINASIKKYNKVKSKKYKYDYIGLFSNVVGKLINKELFASGIMFNEGFQHTEDVIFWAEKYADIKGKIVCCDVSCGEYYCRRVREDSLSRPSLEDELKFYLDDRLEIIEYLENIVFNIAKKYEYQVFLLKLIIAQTNIIKNFYNSSSENKQEGIYSTVKGYKGFLLNKGLFSKKKAIAFCYNFSPTADTSAYVAIKRLRQINDFEGDAFNWTVVSKDTSDIYKNDSIFNMFYAKFLYNDQYFVGGRSSYNSKDQYNFAKIANRRASNIDADVIYSRSMAPASHLAAYLYKKEHPEVKWYAEFSDPIYITSEFVPRVPSNAGCYMGEEEYLNNLFEMCEVLAYESADQIIFTNQNQKDYMLDYNRRKDLTDEINKKSLIWRHPMIERPYVSLTDSKYDLDETKINVGYFGRFYENRSEDEILKLLENKNVVIHLFVLHPKKVEYLNSKRIRVNEAQPYLSFINLASKMDYVFVNDMETENGINPWLPSKISDYLASESMIIGKYVEGSPLSKLSEKQIIKVKEIDKEFADKLVKQKK